MSCWHCNISYLNKIKHKQLININHSDGKEKKIHFYVNLTWSGFYILAITLSLSLLICADESFRWVTATKSPSRSISMTNSQNTTWPAISHIHQENCPLHHSEWRLCCVHISEGNTDRSQQQNAQGLMNHVSQHYREKHVNHPAGECVHGQNFGWMDGLYFYRFLKKSRRLHLF